MSPQNFAYWLQGFFEIAGSSVKEIIPEQAMIIRNHINLVKKCQGIPTTRKTNPPHDLPEIDPNEFDPLGGGSMEVRDMC